MPSLVSVKGLILVFQQEFLTFSNGSFPGDSVLLTRVASTSIADLHQFCTGIVTKAILQYALVIPLSQKFYQSIRVDQLAKAMFLIIFIRECYVQFVVLFLVKMAFYLKKNQDNPDSQ